ncbi:MAG: helix-turn-helix domain-containing protein, partial [Desulfovibrio sp.]|nr:helix-turn-helix domain-containing protein [Desulfovibrio sp.]
MRTPIYLEISPDHLKKLETIANSGKSEVDQALRAKILLKKAQGLSNAAIASDLGVNRHTIEL